MGWVFAIVMAVATFVAIWRIARPTRIVLELTGVAMLVALAGYAWQGQPSYDGVPRASTARAE